MREVEHAERAVDDREARADQREQRAEHQTVEHLRDEIRPVQHVRAPVDRRKRDRLTVRRVSR